MIDLVDRARAWVAGDPDPETRHELEALIEAGDHAELESRVNTHLTFGTAGIRGVVGAGPGRMNRAVVITTTYGLASLLVAEQGKPPFQPTIVGFDARPTSRQLGEDTAGVLAAAGVPVIFFPEVTPTPLVAFAAKHLNASAAVVITASHNPPADNGYKVYWSDAAPIVPPVDLDIQAAIETAPPATSIPRIEKVFEGVSDLVRPAPRNILDCYWEEVESNRWRRTGSKLKIVYTPVHGVGGRVLIDVMSRAGHTDVTTVPQQGEPDGTFPTVAFPNPEESGTLDLALELAARKRADLVIANDPDADRLAVVLPSSGGWRPLTGNEIGVMLADYLLSHIEDPVRAIIASSIVSSPMIAGIAAKYGARHARTLTGFKWIVKAGMSLERAGHGRFVFGYEEALGYTVGSTVRDKDGISAAVIFTDLVADLDDGNRSVMDYLAGLWAEHGLWVSAQTSITRPGPDGAVSLGLVVERLADDPPGAVGGRPVTAVTDYRKHADERPPWLGEQSLVELALGDSGRVLVRPSGTEPKLKIYVDLRETLTEEPVRQHSELLGRATALGQTLAAELAL